MPLEDEGFAAAHAFESYANWLIPGRLMLGRYPYIEPSRCGSREQGEQQLRRLLEAGITTFVALQAEVDAQETLRVGGQAGFLPYLPTATLLHAAMGAPPGAEDLEGLRNQYLNSFLPPRRKQKRHAQEQAPARGRLHFARFPIVDLDIPTPELMEGALADLRARLGAGERVYVHCWGGRGRAGTVGACALAALYDLPADEALARVQRAFNTRGDDGRASPETPEQIEFVRQYVAANPP
ncbi:hypothetical protein WJX81_004471 [Elliptochloris bilobata]|uniref:Tyrosine specific protein phosphatases domain-containing protein n=1 Tax=Elliptochloris bilobata TaxID=381761 RepID=A0AAW1QKC9_9CHLO